MSDKDRNKKDHQRKDKKNKRMHERENPQTLNARPQQQARDESNLNEVITNAKRKS
ncbi:MAG TPA: hypothetical protein VGD38_13585 [Pyrinomonadaceae bacterium]